MNDIAFVFDLDETLGYFSQISVLWKLLNQIQITNNKQELGQIEFNMLIKEFEYLFRPKIIQILKYINDNKNENSKIIIYTNNQISKRWVLLIKNYIEDKLQSTIFDVIIYAHKINGEIVEPMRSGTSKTYNDLIRCANLSTNTKICYVDDRLHKEICKSDQVYYVKLSPYIIKIPWELLLKDVDKLNLIEKKIIIFKNDFNKKVSIENLIYEYEECYLKNKIVYFLKKYMKKTLKFKNIENKTKKIKY